MIPLSRVLTEIDKHASTAKLRGDDQSIRDSLLAIRALCDVALNEQVQPRAVEPFRVAQSAPAVAPSISAGERMKEDDANGESLFDF